MKALKKFFTVIWMLAVIAGIVLLDIFAPITIALKVLFSALIAITGVSIVISGK